MADAHATDKHSASKFPKTKKDDQDTKLLSHCCAVSSQSSWEWGGGSGEGRRIEAHGATARGELSGFVEAVPTSACPSRQGSQEPCQPRGLQRWHLRQLVCGKEGEAQQSSWPTRADAPQCQGHLHPTQHGSTGNDLQRLPLRGSRHGQTGAAGEFEFLISK